MKMTGEDKAAEREANRLNYCTGVVALTEAVKGFKELTGVDLLDAVDNSRRYVGEEPYLVITAERLREITAKIEGDIWQTSGDLPELVPVDATVLQFSAYRPSVKR